MDNKLKDFLLNMDIIQNEIKTVGILYGENENNYKPKAFL